MASTSTLGSTFLASFARRWPENNLTTESATTYAERVEQLNAEFVELNATGKISSWPTVTPECARMSEVLSELEAIQGCGAVVYVKPSEVVKGLHTDLLIGIARNRIPLTVRSMGSTQAGRTNCVDSEGRRFNLRNAMLSSEVADLKTNPITESEVARVKAIVAAASTQWPLRPAQVRIYRSKGVVRVTHFSLGTVSDCRDACRAAGIQTDWSTGAKGVWGFSIPLRSEVA